jgi:putative aldouronate transport system substrate-binding protein
MDRTGAAAAYKNKKSPFSPRVYFALLALIFPFLLITISCGPSEESQAEQPLITWWSPNRAEAFGRTMADLPVYKELMKRTGIAVRFIHPPSGQHAEQFKVMAESDKLPDIISHDFVNDYPGGVERALADGIITPINGLIEEHAPNLSAYLEEKETVARMIRTGGGTYFCFPSLQIEPEIRSYMGPFYRKDIFDALNIAPPRTPEEWTAALRKIKESSAVDIPLTFYGGNIKRTNAFIGAYGIGWGFYLDGGKVKYGPMEPEFAEFLALFSGWYGEGFIDPGFPFNSSRYYRRQIRKKTFAVYVDYVSSIDTYTTELRKRDPGAVLAPLPYPAAPEHSREGTRGPEAEFGHLAAVFLPFASAFISSAGENGETAARLLDYAYSAEGRLLFNFGIPGESYELDNRKPVLKRDIAKNDDGFSAAIKRYIIAGPYLKDPEQFRQMLVRPEQKESVLLWGSTNAVAHLLPPLYPDAETGGELETIMRRIKPYEEEAVIGFVTGELPLEEIGGFWEIMEEIGIRRAVEIMQTCYDKTGKQGM